MKKILGLSMFMLGLIIFSCSKSNDSSNNTPATHDCNISLPTLMTTAKGSVTYMVTLKGTGKVDKISYLSTDSVTINSPTLPYKVVINVEMGVGVGMKVTGSTTGGTITASYSYLSDGSNSATTDSDDCGN